MATSGTSIAAHGRARMCACAAAVLLLLAMFPGRAGAQGTVVFDSIRSEALARNLAGDSPERELTVYLPPGYASSDKRYPVVYMLHGFLTRIKNRVWLDPSIHVDTLLDSLFTMEGIAPFIMVMPDGDNRYHGSFYGSSPVIGDYERYIVHEIPEFMEKHYRVIPGREGRALTGHSMGGFGAAYLGLKYADRYAALGIMSAHLNKYAGKFADYSGVPNPTTWEEWEAMDWHIQATYALCAAFSPAPGSPPFYVEPPWTFKNGRAVQSDRVWERLRRISPPAMVSRYAPNLKSYKGIIMTVGTEEDPGDLPEDEEFHDILQRHGIRHEYHQIYGTHLSVMPRSIKIHSRFLRQFLAGE